MYSLELQSVYNLFTWNNFWHSLKLHAGRSRQFLCILKKEIFMGHLSTHVLDTMNGCPAAGMKVTLQRVEGANFETLKTLTLNADGRNDGGPLLDAGSMAVGRYRLQFDVAAYFRARGAVLPDPAFIDVVPIDFGIADAQGHYHVPLLVSPWTYSTYRGS